PGAERACVHVHEALAGIATDAADLERTRGFEDLLRRASGQPDVGSLADMVIAGLLRVRRSRLTEAGQQVEILRRAELLLQRQQAVEQLRIDRFDGAVLRLAKQPADPRESLRHILAVLPVDAGKALAERGAAQNDTPFLEPGHRGEHRMAGDRTSEKPNGSYEK